MESVLESEVFLGQEGKRTIFSIECFNGKKIREHSSLEDEDEILLLPGSQFIVKSHLQPSKKDPDLIIIQLIQTEPPYTLLEEPSRGMASTGTSKPQNYTKDVSSGKYGFFYSKIAIERKEPLAETSNRPEIQLFILPIVISDLSR
jgi:hypothetical protein